MSLNISGFGQNSSLNAISSLQKSQKSLSQSMNNIASGLRINRAKDDAAGLSISENLRYQVNGMNMAVRNAQDGSSLLSIAEGALGQSTEILQRMREMAVQASNGTLTNQERRIMNIEFNQYKEELSRISSQTQFNNRKLLDGSLDVKYQVGASKDQQMQVKIGDMSAEGIGLSGVEIGTSGKANMALDAIDQALKNVTGTRAKVGASQNRLEYVVSNGMNTSANLLASESRIRDADLALEVMNMTRNQIQMQTQASVMALHKSNAHMALRMLF